MRRKSPVQRFENQSGFSLIEILMALFITSLLAFTIGYSMQQVLIAEARNITMQETRRILTALTTAQWNDWDPEETVAPHFPQWQIRPDPAIIQSEDESGLSWQSWTLTTSAPHAYRVQALYAQPR